MLDIVSDSFRFEMPRNRPATLRLRPQRTKTAYLFSFAELQSLSVIRLNRAQKTSLHEHIHDVQFVLLKFSNQSLAPPGVSRLSTEIRPRRPEETFCPVHCQAVAGCCRQVSLKESRAAAFSMSNPQPSEDHERTMRLTGNEL